MYPTLLMQNTPLCDKFHLQGQRVVRSAGQTAVGRGAHNYLLQMSFAAPLSPSAAILLLLMSLITIESHVRTALCWSRQPTQWQ